MAKDKRNIITSPRIIELQEARKKRTRIAIIICFFLFIGFVIGASFLSRYHRLLITKVVINGTHIIDAHDVEERINNDLQGRYLYLFTKQNSFIYPKLFIEKDLQKTFPRIEKLDVTLENVNTLIINIGERTGSYLWCGGNVPIDSIDVGENCYFINSDGYIFDKAPYFSGNIYIKFYTPIIDTTNPLNQQVLERDFFRQIISFVDGLTDLGFRLVSVVLVDPENYTFHLTRRSDGGEPEIIFKKDNNITEIFTNLSSAMHNQDFKNEILSKISTLLYIDLRFKNKVLYKFQ